MACRPACSTSTRPAARSRARWLPRRGAVTSRAATSLLIVCGPSAASSCRAVSRIGSASSAASAVAEASTGSAGSVQPVMAARYHRSGLPEPCRRPTVTIHVLLKGGSMTLVDVGLRRLLWGRGVSAVGDGLWFTTWALYLTRVLGHSPATVGLGMAVAGAVGLAATAPIGALADRLDARRLLVALTTVRAAAMCGYLLAAPLPVFLLVTVVFVALANGGSAVRTALVAGLVADPAARVRALAGQRVAQHAGYAVGAAAGALVLTLDSPAGYRLAITANVVTF